MVKEDSDDLNYSNVKYGAWRTAVKTITFVGGTSNGIGDHDGTGDPFTLFTVTGNVIVKVIGVCTTDLVSATGTASVSIGIGGQTATILPVTTATAIDAGEIWHDLTPDAGVEAATVFSEKIVANGADIIGEVNLENVTAGVIKFICWWKPLEPDGDVVAA